MQSRYSSAVEGRTSPSDKVHSSLLTGGQSALERLKVVGMSALKPSSSSSYIKAVLLGKNCSLTLILGGLKMVSNTPLPMLVWNFVSCTIQPADCHGNQPRGLHKEVGHSCKGQEGLQGSCIPLSGVL